MKENDMTEYLKMREKIRREAEKEVDKHKHWCGPNCQTFLPTVYIKRRLEGVSAKSLQDDYDSCHIFR